MGIFWNKISAMYHILYILATNMFNTSHNVPGDINLQQHEFVVHLRYTVFYLVGYLVLHFREAIRHARDQNS